MCFTVVSSYSTSDVCPIFQTICDDKLVVMSAAACTSWVRVWCGSAKLKVKHMQGSASCSDCTEMKGCSAKIFCITVLYVAGEERL